MTFDEYLEVEPLWQQAVDIVRSTNDARISHVQRNLRIGYNRAAWLLEWMEKKAIVSWDPITGDRKLIPPERCKHTADMFGGER